MGGISRGGGCACGTFQVSDAHWREHGNFCEGPEIGRRTADGPPSHADGVLSSQAQCFSTKRIYSIRPAQRWSPRGRRADVHLLDGFLDLAQPVGGLRGGFDAGHEAAVHRPARLPLLGRYAAGAGIGTHLHARRIGVAAVGNVRGVGAGRYRGAAGLHVSFLGLFVRRLRVHRHVADRGSRLVVENRTRCAGYRASKSRSRWGPLSGHADLPSLRPPVPRSDHAVAPKGRDRPGARRLDAYGRLRRAGRGADVRGKLHRWGRDLRD